LGLGTYKIEKADRSSAGLKKVPQIPCEISTVYLWQSMVKVSDIWLVGGKKCPKNNFLYRVNVNNLLKMKIQRRTPLSMQPVRPGRLQDVAEEASNACSTHQQTALKKDVDERHRRHIEHCARLAAGTGAIAGLGGPSTYRRSS